MSPEQIKHVLQRCFIKTEKQKLTGETCVTCTFHNKTQEACKLAVDTMCAVLLPNL